MQQTFKSLHGKGLSPCGDMHQLEAALLPGEGLGQVTRGGSTALRLKGAG